VIANGRQSTALLAELGKRERRLDKISDELLASTDNGLEMKLQKIEEFAMKRLRHIQGDCSEAMCFAQNRNWRKHRTDITLTPKGNSYIVSGDGIYWADVRVVPALYH
jgi:hypothetical protein